MPEDTSEGSDSQAKEENGPDIGEIIEDGSNYYDPDAASESDSEYDGFLSYAKEWHALTLGIAAGLCGRFTKGTQYEPVGVAAMSLVTGLALGLESYSQYKNNPVSNNVRAEPWYALGGMLAAYDGESIMAYLPVDEINLGGLTR